MLLLPQELVPSAPAALDARAAAAALIGLQGLVLAPALAVVAWSRLSALQRVGAARFGDHPRRALRRTAWIAPQLALLAGALALDAVPLGPALLLVAQGVLLALLLPSPHDAVLAAQGVRRGLDARRFEELEEWRLTGEHLRFRLRGEWTSVPAPAAEHAALRARLVAVLPERESPFA